MRKRSLSRAWTVLTLLAGMAVSHPLLAQTAKWQDLYDKALREQAALAYGVAENSARLALEVAEQQHRGQRPYIASSLNLLGLIEQAQGRHAQAAQSLSRALELSQASLGAHANTASIAWNLGNTYESLQQPREAKKYYGRSLELAQSLPVDATSLALAENALQALGRVHASVGEHEQAQVYLEQLSTLLTQGRGQIQGAVRMQGLLGLAHSLEQQGKFKEAQQTLAEALEVLETAGQGVQTHLVPVLLALAQLYGRQGNDAKAAAHYERIRSLLAPQDPQALLLAEVLNELGLWQAQNKAYGQADALFEQAQRIASKHAPDAMWQAHLLLSRARMADAMQQEGLAKPLYEQSLQLYRSQDTPQALMGQAGALNGLAGLVYRKRRFNEAQPLFAQALGLMEQAVGYSDERLLPLLDNLAALSRSLGRHGKSDHARRAAALRKAAATLN